MSESLLQLRHFPFQTKILKGDLRSHLALLGVVGYDAHFRHACSRSAQEIIRPRQAGEALAKVHCGLQYIFVEVVSNGHGVSQGVQLRPVFLVLGRVQLRPVFLVLGRVQLRPVFLVLGRALLCLWRRRHLGAMVVMIRRIYGLRVIQRRRRLGRRLGSVSSFPFIQTHQGLLGVVERGLVSRTRALFRAHQDSFLLRATVRKLSGRLGGDGHAGSSLGTAKGLHRHARVRRLRTEAR
eukprot:scaffold320_cov367-Pinguiococcus_pyrenoidosus.AAC.3